MTLFSVIQCFSGSVSGVQVPAAAADCVLFDRTVVLLMCVLAFWIYS